MILSIERKFSGRIVFVITALLLSFFNGTAVPKENNKAPATITQKPASTRLVKDMLGRGVRIPVTVTKVLATSPPAISFVYMLAPEKLKGWMSPGPASGDKSFVPKAYQNLLLIPRGLSSTTYEAYIAAQPEFVIYECEHKAEKARIDMIQAQMGSVPVVAFSINETRDMPEYSKTIRFMGNLLGVPERAEKLIAYYNNVIAEVQRNVSSIPENKRVSMYYAEGLNGLTTDPKGSQHSQLIDLCGGINAAKCPPAGQARTNVTMESVLMWQPEVIVATDRQFIKNALADNTWRKIPAVKNNRVYLIPTKPFNWFDRPPGINRIAGIPWVAHLLYPDKFSREWLRKKIREIYSNFYHYELSDKELAGLLAE